MSQIKTIDVSAKEWFDKTYGNSYHSAQITVNYGMPDAVTLYAPMEYGYGDSYMETANRTLIHAGRIPENTRALWLHCRDNKIVLRNNIQRKCLKRDVVAWGKN